MQGHGGMSCDLGIERRKATVPLIGSFPQASCDFGEFSVNKHVTFSAEKLNKHVTFSAEKLNKHVTFSRRIY